MDLGMVGLDGLVVGSSSDSCCFSSSDPDHETKLKCYGSGFLKQERTASAATSTNTTTEDYWSSRRSLIKVAKTDDSDFSANNSKAMLLQQRSPSLMMRSNSSSLSLLSNGQQMLSFSSPNSSQTLTSPYYHPTSTTTTYSRNTGYGSEGLNALSMHGVLTGVSGPFTPSQWMELEHQALIYKYITANVPIPSNLLFPIRKALDSVGFSSFSGGPLRPMGWGGFHMGFSNNADPEPGRCRRTDGKKWRCSRDAVADQKYCERHMNRGRHRSRKPVEGQSGHSVSGATAGKVIPVASSTAALVAAGGSAPNSLGLKNLQPGGAPNPCASSSSHINRIFLDKESLGDRIHDATDLSMLSPTIHVKENRFSIPKQHNTYEETSRAEFGHVCSDSLLNPLHKSFSLITSRNYGSSQDLNDRENESQRSVRQFIGNWPKTQTNRSAISWPDLDLQTDRTQLSISIPVAASDFMSSTSSPANGKLALSPLRLSRELNEPSQRQANWIPISWETSMGGPLGEVLNSTNSSAGDCKNSSALNLMTEGWDSSPTLASSPTGVLQKVTFGSLSNSSTGSSPRAENLGSTLVNSSLSLPAL